PAGAVTRRASKACRATAVPKPIAGNTAGRECRCSPGPAGAVTRQASKAPRTTIALKATTGSAAGKGSRRSPGLAGAVTQKASEVPVGVRAFGRMLSPSCHPWVAAAVLRVPRAEASPTCQTWWTRVAVRSLARLVAPFLNPIRALLPIRRPVTVTPRPPAPALVALEPLGPPPVKVIPRPPEPVPAALGPPPVMVIPRLPEPVPAALGRHPAMDILRHPAPVLVALGINVPETSRSPGTYDSPELNYPCVFYRSKPAL
ncbi:hypothetical protein K466DRAFT_610856, partial [Polyporus arcularius HHB13444]